MTALQNITEAPIRVKRIPAAEARKRAAQLHDRVGLASIMLFAEPTPARSPELGGAVLAVMKDLARSHMTMLVATREFASAREIGDALTFMDAGLVFERGYPRTVLSDPREARNREFLSRVL